MTEHDELVQRLLTELAEKDAEIERLRQWKDEGMEVLDHD